MYKPMLYIFSTKFRFLEFVNSSYIKRDVIEQNLPNSAIYKKKKKKTTRLNSRYFLNNLYTRNFFVREKVRPKEKKRRAR